MPYPDLFHVSFAEATDYPFLHFSAEWKLCRELQDNVDQPHLAVGTAPEAGLDYYPGTPPVPGVENPGFFLRPALAERRFRVRHGVIAPAVQRDV